MRERQDNQSKIALFKKHVTKQIELLMHNKHSELITKTNSLCAIKDRIYDFESRYQVAC